MKFDYTPKGVCAREIHLDVEDGVIKSVSFDGGCAGNTRGVAALCVGRSPEEVIEILDGTLCGNKGTSCPDQLAQALKEMTT